MVTEADMRNWKQTDFTPYLDVVTEAFGIDRIIYGSDWPVCLAASSYKDVIGIVQNYFLLFQRMNSNHSSAKTHQHFII